MKQSWKYIAGLIVCLFLAYGANAQRFYPPYRYNRFNNYNNRNYYNTPEKNQYQTYSDSSGRKLLLSLNYAVAGGVGSLHDYINNTSPRGWRAKGIYEINSHWGAGLTFGFNDFYQKLPRQIYHEKGSDISAVQSRTLQVVPILATGVYSFSSQSFIKPYVALGAGVNSVTYSKWWGEFEDKNNKWSFALRPEAGVQIPFGKNARTGINIGVAYNYSPYSFNEIKSLGYWEGNAGLYFHLR